MTTPHRTPIPPPQLTALEDVRTTLSRVWMIGAGLVFIVLVVQSLIGVYADLTEDAWGWFLPTILPTLTMILTVLTYTALDPTMTGFVVRKTFASTATWLSIFYLLVVSLTFVTQPFIFSSLASQKERAAAAITLMRMSNLWLGPLQGLVASALGVLFVSKHK